MSSNILTAINIIDMRNKMGISRDDLANMLGVSNKTVARWENHNNNEPPSGTAAIVLSFLVSNALNLPLEDKSDLMSEFQKIHEKSKMKENPDTIFLLLNQATSEEKNEICKALKLPSDSDLYQISKEYRSTAGHTVGNWFRGDHDMPYKEILVDVANKLKPKKDPNVYMLGDGRSEEDVENKILDYFADKIAEELNKMSPDERAKKMDSIKQSLYAGRNVDDDSDSINETIKVLTAGTVSGASVALLLTGSVTSHLFYSGIFAGLWASVFGMSSSLLLLTGTGVTTVLSLPVLLIWLGSPSYRKTIPVTLQLINIRRRVNQSIMS